MAPFPSDVGLMPENREGGENVQRPTLNL